MQPLTQIFRFFVQLGLWLFAVLGLVGAYSWSVVHDWISASWALATFALCGSLIVLKKKTESKLKLAAAALVPFAIGSAAAAVSAFFMSAGWSGYSVFILFLAPVVLIAATLAITIYDQRTEPNLK